MINQVVLHGNTGVEPHSSYTATGKMVTKFSLAVNRNYGERDADWFNVECWGKLAEVMQKHGFKGQELLVRGQIRTESYNKDGDTKYYTKIVASEIDILKWATNQPDFTISDEDLTPSFIEGLQKLYAQHVQA